MFHVTMFRSTSIDKHWVPRNEQEHLFVKSGTRCIIQALLPPANEVLDKDIFSQACVSHSVYRGCRPWVGASLVGVLSLETGVLSLETGVLSLETGMLSLETGVLSLEGSTSLGGAVLTGAGVSSLEGMPSLRGGGTIEGCREWRVL